MSTLTTAAPSPMLTTISDYQRLAVFLGKRSDQAGHFRNLCLTDLYWLLRYGCKRVDLERQWLLDRCREVQANPNGYLDLWAREHYKSTIITFGLTIQDILNDPEVTVGLFSHTRPIAKGFLRQIKRELESNSLLKALFSDILWSDPQKEAPKWSEDDGIIVRRKTNPKESTVEAWGVVDGQPTSKHFAKLVYDDIVVKESVTTPEMIAKTTDSLAMSYNLGAAGGVRRFIGTRYHFNDTYKTVLERGTAKVRSYPATADGEVDGEPVLLTRPILAEKRRDMGPYIFSSQMLQNPTADRTQGFRREWIKHYSKNAEAISNRYMLVDAASEKRKENDYTAIWVIGLGADENYYVLDMLRDRLNLTQRADAVFRLHRKWKPMETRYERYGLMADTEHIRDRMESENYRFNLVEVGGPMPKNDRIKRLVPSFEQGKWYFPVSLNYTDYENIVRDLVHSFLEEEYVAFPVALHDDMLDSLARLMDTEGTVEGKSVPLSLIWPRQTGEDRPKRYAGGNANSVSVWAR